nr:uncharacterized protein LOC125422872 [Ziziphus jujuba var. spinosa]
MDMQKAYDMIDWVVLTRILTLFGFLDRCTKLILNYISSPSMELMLNGSVFGKIPMERGLRQGDPLSPFLFILVTELLSRLLHSWESEGKFNGVKLGRLSPSITHLLFVDDILIFYQANSEELNKDSKYLDFPLFLERNKVCAFEELKRNLETRIQRWKAKLLSQASRATLIKHVATSIPVYTMSTFLLLKVWCDNFEKLARSFFWNNDHKVTRSFMLIAWRKVCSPKQCGLGVKRIWSFNKALIAKLGWSMATKQDKLWMKALKAKHFPNTTFLKCKKKKGCSWLWFGVLSTKSLLAKVFCYQVGKGDTVNFWEDPWIPNSPRFLPKPTHHSALNSVGMVNSLKLSNGCWNEAYLASLFDLASVENIKRIFWAKDEEKDKIVWLGSKTGAFTVKSAYSLEEGFIENNCAWWKTIDIPEVAEMEAILKALQVASSYGWSNICLEFDASAVIDSLATKNRKALHWQAEHLVNLIFQLTPLFANVSFVWIARENNRCAHLVGQWAKKFSFFGEVDLYSLPPYFVSLLIQESDHGVAT